ncbi:MAG: hypothetical protein EXS06_04865 [Planctomycetaceae bacterium]|nr:hypothetical protein [Planctomycetaceae bacterium]
MLTQIFLTEIERLLLAAAGETPDAEMPRCRSSPSRSSTPKAGADGGQCSAPVILEVVPAD